MTNRFAPDTFAADPRPSAPFKMLAAQSRLELTLFLRNGEQLLLTMLIPITMLIGLTYLPIGEFGDHRIDKIVPATLMVAVMGTAFTGQAIAVGFDRRYGALKRLGATALPRWGIIVGKSVAVAGVVAIQVLVLGGLGFALGWRPSIGGLALMLIFVAIGTVTFSTMGLLLGGTLKAEIVLALANILWFVMLAIGSAVFATESLPTALEISARLIPSGALAESLTQASVNYAIDALGLAVLLIWASICGVLAARTFRFE